MTKQPEFRKNISTFSLTMTGVTAIIGSGWLLGTQKIAVIAGPASMLSWILGAFVALLVGLFYIEIGSTHPSSGGIGYYSHLTHGRFCGFLTSWINWLSIVAVAPIEAQSIVQYLSQLSPAFIHLYNLETHNLSSSGIAFALVLMLFFMFINYWSVQIFIRFNNFFTMLKIAIPLLTIGSLAYAGLHPQNFGRTVQEFMPFGWKSILTSVVACGVVMSFNGFQSPLNFSEEIKSPKRQLPIAVIGSILISFVIYFLLQAVFIGSVNPAVLVHGWQSINFRSPYIDLLLLANLQLMVTTVYIGSVISPSACGAAFIASSSRIMHSLSSEKHLPEFLGILNAKYRNPRHAIIICTAVGALFLFMFKGWYTLVAVISVLHLFSYVPAPIITIANRIKNKELHQHKEPFTLPFAHFFAPFLLFIISALIFYSAWPLADEMALLIIPGLAFFFYYEYKQNKGTPFWPVFKGASWLLFYIVGISIITFLGNNAWYPANFISTQASMILLALLSLITYIYGAYYAFDHAPYTSLGVKS
ncbi:MAG: APC family permease [Legionellales bacterium]|nr:APC family permease [Legionellales bacterium]